MPPIPRLSAPQVERILSNNDFLLVRVRGSHARYTNGTGNLVTVPRHGSRTLDVRVMASIIKQSGLGVEAFAK